MRKGSGQEDGMEVTDVMISKGDSENRAVTGPGKQSDLSAGRCLTTFGIPLWCNKQDSLKISLETHCFARTMNSSGPEAPPSPNRRNCTQIQLPVGSGGRFLLPGRKGCF